MGSQRSWIINAFFLKTRLISCTLVPSRASEIISAWSSLWWVYVGCCINEWGFYFLLHNPPCGYLDLGVYLHNVQHMQVATCTHSIPVNLQEVMFVLLFVYAAVIFIISLGYKRKKGRFPLKWAHWYLTSPTRPHVTFIKYNFDTFASPKLAAYQHS